MRPHLTSIATRMEEMWAGHKLGTGERNVLCDAMLAASASGGPELRTQVCACCTPLGMVFLSTHQSPFSVSTCSFTQLITLSACCVLHCSGSVLKKHPSGLLYNRLFDLVVSLLYGISGIYKGVATGRTAVLLTGSLAETATACSCSTSFIRLISVVRSTSGMFDHCSMWQVVEWVLGSIRTVWMDAAWQQHLASSSAFLGRFMPLRASQGTVEVRGLCSAGHVLAHHLGHVGLKTHQNNCCRMSSRGRLH